MPDDWVVIKLSDVADVRHGFAFEGEFFRNEPPGDILLTPGNFRIGGGFKNDSLKYYVGPVPDEFVLEEGDLLVTMTDLSKNGDTLGYPAIVPCTYNARFLHNQRLGKVNIKQAAPLDKCFLYYLLCTPGYRNEILASATGTTVKHTSPQRILSFSFRMPPISEQRAIGQTLGALDDKIELNRRMNETLEAMARAIFKSWFVDFEPVRAKIDGRWRRGQSLPGLPANLYDLFPDSFEHSPLGEIPKGWRTTRLGDAFEINPPRSLPPGAMSPYLDMANMPWNSPRPLGWVDRAFTSGMKFINGDTLLARITPCLENGKTAFVDFLADGQVGWGSTECIALRSKAPFPVEYSYFLARSDDFRAHAIANMTGTSGRQRVPVSCLDGYIVVVSSPPVAERFREFVQPTMAAIKQRDEESRALAAIRDALLPKLISGELRVKDSGKPFTEKRLRHPV
jgi:type I restriction enzyme S subunit